MLQSAHQLEKDTASIRKMEVGRCQGIQKQIDGVRNYQSGIK